MSSESIDSFHKSDKSLSVLVDNIPGVVFRCLPDKYFTMKFLSDNIKALTGFSAANFIDNQELSFASIIHEDDLQEVRNRVRDGEYEGEYRIITRSGDIKWVKESGQQVYYEEEDKTYLEGIILDISDRKNIENQLEKSKERYQTIFETAPFGIMLEDEKGNILEVNESMTEITGYSREELVGSNVCDKLAPAVYEEAARDNIARILAGNDLDFEAKSRNKNGEIYYTRLKETRINLPQGKKGILSMQTDITERKMMEAKLQEEKERFESLFYNSTDAIIAIDSEGYILDVNKNFEELFKYKLENIKGRHIDETLKIEGKQDSVDKSLTEKLLAGEQLDREVTRYDRDGNPLEVFLRTAPITVSGEVVGGYAIYLDITERKKMETRLELTQFSVDNAAVLIFWHNSEGEFRYVNRATCEKLGYNRRELLNLGISDIDSNYTEAKVKQYWQNLQEKETLNFESRLETKTGETFPAEVTSHYLEYRGEEFGFAFVQDISDRKQKEEQLKYKTFHDELTGLYNRTFLAEEMERLDTERQLPISIIMVDVNGLKIINDTFGHDKGDKVLKKSAEILQSVIREEDILARYGGDEFVILLPQTDNEIAHAIYERIERKCEKTTRDNLPVSLGMGIATKTSPTEELEEILKQADDNMLQNKLVNSKSRKNRMVKGLLNTLGAKSYETKEHAMRMTELAHRLGEKIGVSNSHLNKLSLLATLHDIGKTSLPEEILTKAGELSEKEWERVKQHPERGYKIASASEEFAAIAEEVFSHHEHWDGSGYPRGLKGEEIPLLARIISIVDAYDVMTTGRPYKEAVSKEEALKEIENCAGSQFDPELAEKFVKMMRKD